MALDFLKMLGIGGGGSTGDPWASTTSGAGLADLFKSDGSLADDTKKGLGDTFKSLGQNWGNNFSSAQGGGGGMQGPPAPTAFGEDPNMKLALAMQQAKGSTLGGPGAKPRQAFSFMRPSWLGGGQ